MGIINILKSCATILSNAKAANSVPVPDAKPDYLDYSVGDLTNKYETSNRGPGYISTGDKWGDPGGVSYGSYQIETKQGTMQEYLKGRDPFIDELKGLLINSISFRNKWQELAASDPKGFQQSQFNFLAHKPRGYVDAYNYAKSLGWNVDSFAMQSAIYSTVNQSGGWKDGIFDKAGINQNNSIAEQINKLYDARANYFRKLNMNTTVKKNIILNRTDENMDGTRSRLNNERDDALKLIK